MSPTSLDQRAKFALLSARTGRAVCLTMVVYLLLSVVVPTAGKRRKATERQEGPVDQSVWEQDLVAEAVSAQAILQHSGQFFLNTSQRNFAGPVLAYVTPWNGHGYDIAEQFKAKFSHVAPVWFQLRQGPEGPHITGQHDVDSHWIAQLRSPAHPGARVPKVVPRLIAELQPEELLRMMAEPEGAAELIVTECMVHRLDGFVLEGWASWDAMGVMRHEQYAPLPTMFIKRLAQRMHATKSPSGQSLELLLAVPPALPSGTDRPRFMQQQFQDLVDEVDGFSVMTYDYSHPGTPGWSAPLPWVESNLRELLPDQQCASDGTAAKVLLGLNFFGMHHNTSNPAAASAIVGHEYLDLLEKLRPSFHWNQDAQEHVVLEKTNKALHTIYYPSLQSIQARLNVAAKHGSGISIWEIGQGLDFFYDLL